MNRHSWSSFFITVVSIGFGLWGLHRLQHLVPEPEAGSRIEDRREEGFFPDPTFYLQRAYPLDTIPLQAVSRARQQAQALQTRALRESLLSWQPGGPYNIGGRITAIAADPSNPMIVYAGAADGGVLKSTDGGLHWTPIFDEMPSLSIGAITIDPTDPSKIYVGTGEANSSGDSFDGDGLYMSPDGGTTWVHLGLEQTRHINRIVVNPQNPQVLFVAAMGSLFSPSPDRGVYRSLDGGQTWEQVLFVSDTTGCIDLAINPENPQILYAAMWERIRRPWMRRVGGPTSGIYRSTDGGETWELLTNGLPQGANVGRIGLALAPSNPQVIYAIYADHPGYFMGIYKTTDGGDTWFRVNDAALSNLFSSYGWYFGNIRVDPTNENVVYALGLDLYRSTNGGNSWQNLTGYSVHVDQHDLWIDPQNPQHLILGNDGGIYVSNNGGISWTKSTDLPITQFYRVTVDFLNPERIYGGTQDNGTMRTLTGSVDDWQIIYWGDGFFCIVDYTNPNVIYAEYQYGGLGKSTDGGYTFYDATAGIGPDRRNWNTPVVMDPNNPQVLYYGTYRVYKTTNGAGWWFHISPDLTNGPGGGNLQFGTITAIAVSDADPNVLYVGTDDGRVWMTPDGGGAWIPVDDSLPDRWVTDIAILPGDPNTAYVAFSGYAWDEPYAHLWKTTDGGTTWQDVSGDLPECPVNTIVIDPATEAVIVGTDFGVYVSTDDSLWTPVGTGLPNAVVMDMVFHPTTRKLVVGTHGRSTWWIELPITTVEETSGDVFNGWKMWVLPQPFSGRGFLQLQVPHRQSVFLDMFDPTGRRVDRLFLGNLPAGRHQIPLRIPFSRPVGIYTLRLSTEGNRTLQTFKVALVSPKP